MITHDKRRAVIAETENGCVLRHTEPASGSELLQVEFGNIFLKFEPNSFTVFKSFIDAVDVERWEAVNQGKPYHRKIFVELKPSGVMLAFRRDEIAELRALLSGAEAMLLLLGFTKTPSYSLN